MANSAIALLAFFATAPIEGTGVAAIAPTVEIAEGVFLPMISDGYPLFLTGGGGVNNTHSLSLSHTDTYTHSYDYGKQTNSSTNYTAWFQLGGRGVDTAWFFFSSFALSTQDLSPLTTLCVGPISIKSQWESRYETKKLWRERTFSLQPK